MAVGTGSIKRASKASNVKAETAKNKAAVKQEVEEKQETAEVATVEEVVKNEASAKKTTTAKRTTKAATKKETNSINPVCHLTEDLPIHLL